MTPSRVLEHSARQEQITPESTTCALFDVNTLSFQHQERQGQKKGLIYARRKDF